MIKLENQPDFKKISYNKESETLNIEDYNGNKMIFTILPYFLFEMFRESGYTNNFLQTKIIGNPKLKWVNNETVEGISYNRLKKKNIGKNKENFKK
ncbi:MAG: hypothetical protein KO253_04015 [Methanobrevibacter arboriphilus]|nr:hypothetical protein [Methanobrevibacter arboriphilus]